MTKSKAIFWLGKHELERLGHGSQRGSCSARRSGQDRSIGALGDSGTLTHPDKQLISGAIRLCDLALRHFEERGDPEAQRFIDQFTVSFMSLIVQYFAARSRH